ncbi:MAG: hypothetical protein ACRD0X_03205, partial [Thermoanaerobaculia bacterium]
MSESELLRFYLQGLRRFTGASALTLYVPGSPNGPVALLVHEGDEAPLPELASAAEAEAFAAQAPPPPGEPLDGRALAVP